MEAKGQGFDSSCGLFVPCSWWDDKHLSTRNAPLVCSDITAMEDPPRPPMDSARSLEMSGYMPCRGDFDVVMSSIFSFGMKL